MQPSTVFKIGNMTICILLLIVEIGGILNTVTVFKSRRVVELYFVFVLFALKFM